MTGAQFEIRIDGTLPAPKAAGGRAAHQEQESAQHGRGQRPEKWRRYRGGPQAVVQPVADIDDLAVAVETYEAACKRWPGKCFTLRQGSRVIADSRQTQPTKK